MSRWRQRTVHNDFFRRVGAGGNVPTAPASAAAVADGLVADGLVGFAPGSLVTSGTLALRRSASSMRETASSENGSRRGLSLAGLTLDCQHPATIDSPHSVQQTCPHRQFFHIYAGQTTSQRNQSTLEPSPGPLRPGSHKHTGGTCYARKDPSGKPIPDRSGTRNGSRYCPSRGVGRTRTSQPGSQRTQQPTPHARSHVG